MLAHLPGNGREWEQAFGDWLATSAVAIGTLAMALGVVYLVVIALDIVVRVQTWEVWLSLVVSVNAVAGILYGVARWSVRYVQRYMRAATEALDRRRHDELVALRNDILTALDQVTPGVDKFAQLKEGDLGSNGSSGS